jgi:hypothetical protein
MIPRNDRRDFPIALWHWDPSCDALDRAFELNDRGYALYVGVNPRRSMGSGRKQFVAGISAIPIDVDEKKTGYRFDDVIDQMTAIGLSPCIAVSSGGGGHAYLLLDCGYPVEEAAIVAARVCLAFPTGDPAVKAPTQVMRLPGSWNWKTDPPEPCTLLGVNSRRYSLDEITAALDRAGAPQLETVVTADPLIMPDAPGALTDIVGRLPARLADVVCTGKASGDMSALDWTIVRALISLGASDGQIREIYAAFPVRGLKVDRAGDGYLDRTLSRARAAARMDLSDRSVDAALLETGLFYELEDGTVIPDMEACRMRVRAGWGLDRLVHPRDVFVNQSSN